MKTIYLLVAVVSVFVMSAKSQIKKKAARIDQNPFQQVKVSDSVRHKLAEFLWITSKDSSGIMINHVLGKDKTSQYQFVEGVYRFRLNKIPAITYHFVYTKGDGVQIIKEISIESTFRAVLGFFKMNESTLNSQDKLDYLSVLLIDMKERERMLKPGFHGDYEVFGTSGFIQEKGISIDSIYLKLAKGRNISHQKIEGEFIYPENNEGGAGYIAKFIGKERQYSLVHTAYPGIRKDNFRINNQFFTLDAKMDPLSLVVYRLSLSNKRYLCLIGKGQSASGSGVQLSFFTVLELDKLGRATNYYQFSSRFGNIHNIVDYNNNGSINHLKMVNGDKMGQYILTVNDIKSGKRINNRLVLLDYKLNDKFHVLKDTIM
ncbi:hypothetical protein [Pedobacter gandavensis]|uniref:hypothetical protein n=1 Tax=Pedobacter gandavensis TaxID=2679963 RepID=UPI00292EA2CD|nr:hypothetical protein [Pedobacter gandavensis]